MIEGLRQGLRYNSAKERLRVRLRFQGKDATPKGDAKAELDFAGAGCANLNAVVEFYQAGAHGGLWKFVTESGGLATGQITVDLTAKTVTFAFEANTTTIGDFNNCIAGLRGTDDVVNLKTAGTPTDTVLTGGDAGVDNYLTGGTYVEPTITILDPGGTEIAAAQDMTQVGSTSVWYCEFDTTDTTTWAKGVDYRALVEYSDFDNELPVQDHIWFDVALFPFNEPLITSEEIASMRPHWELPEDWSDWTQAIELAHVQLYNDLRSMRDNRGKPVYPQRLIDRNQLRTAARAYTFRECARVCRLEEKEMEDAFAQADNILPTLLSLDRDDDLVKDSDEEAALVRTFIR